MNSYQDIKFYIETLERIHSKTKEQYCLACLSFFFIILKLDVIITIPTIDRYRIPYTVTVYC